jgi:hypothetical protein
MAAFPRLAVDAWPCRCGRHSHPPRPAHAETCALPKRAPPHECSLQASLFFPTRSSLDQSKRARARYFFSPRVGRWEPPASCERCTAPLLRSLLLGDGETQCSKVHSNGRSKLAHSPFGAGLIGLLLRAWTSTDFLQIRLIWCARSASKGDQQPSPLSFWGARWASKGSCLAYPIHSLRSQAAIGPCGFTHR